MKVKLTEQYLYYMGKRIEKGGKFSLIETQMLKANESNTLTIEKSELNSDIGIYYFRKKLKSGKKSSKVISLIKDYHFIKLN